MNPAEADFAGRYRQTTRLAFLGAAVAWFCGHNPAIEQILVGDPVPVVLLGSLTAAVWVLGSWGTGRLGPMGRVALLLAQTLLLSLTSAAAAQVFFRADASYAWVALTVSFAALALACAHTQLPCRAYAHALVMVAFGLALGALFWRLDIPVASLHGVEVTVLLAPVWVMLRHRASLRLRTPS